MFTARHLAVLTLISTACGVAPVGPPRIEHDAALDFGPVAASNFATRAFTLRNAGDAPVTVTLSLDEGPFSVTKTSVAVDRRASVTLEIRFAPSSLGPVTRVLHLRTGDATSDVRLTGSGTGPQVIAPGALSFGLVPLVTGHPDVARQTLTVRNTGTSGTVLHVALPTVDGDEVCVGEWSGDTCTPWTPTPLEVGASVNVPLTLKPNTTGAREWHLSFLSDDPLTLRHEVTLRAVVEAASPCDLDLQPSLTHVPEGGFGVVTARHLGPGRCFIRALEIQGDFVVDPAPTLPLALEMNASLRVPVVARFATPGISQGSLHFRTAGGGDFRAFLRRESSACLGVSPSAIDFGTVQVNCSGPSRTVQLYNICSRPIDVTNVRLVAAAGEPAGGSNCPGPSVCPEFSLSAAPSVPVQLQPGSPIGVTVTYGPINYGPDTGALGIETSAGTYVVALQGGGETAGFVLDRYYQGRVPRADWLFLVDSSPSFVPKRASVRTSIAAVLGMLSRTRCLEVRVAFAAAEGAPDGGRSLLMSDAGHQWFSSGDAGFVDEALSALDTLPVGSEVEACVGPASELLHAADSGVRAGVPFNGVCITDALEQTPDAGGVWADVQALVSDGGFARAWWNTVVARPGSSCAVEAVDDGTHAALTTASYGIGAEICDPRWFDAFSIGTYGQCTTSEFHLTSRPSAANPIDVRIEGQSIPAVDAQGAAVWRYDAASNAIEFTPLHVPAEGSSIEVRYGAACIE